MWQSWRALKQNSMMLSPELELFLDFDQKPGVRGPQEYFRRSSCQRSLGLSTVESSRTFGSIDGSFEIEFV